MNQSDIQKGLDLVEDVNEYIDAASDCLSEIRDVLVSYNEFLKKELKRLM